MLNLRGRQEQECERSGSDCDSKLDEDFDFGSVVEAEGEERGGNCREEPKTAKLGGDKAKKGEKAKTKTWSDVVKGLKKENESKVADSVEQFDLDELNYIMAMRKWRQQKPTPTRKSRQVEGR